MKYKSQTITGKGRGKELGFPTINLNIPKVFVKNPGVYAGWVYLEGQKLPAAIHFGPTPVFNDKNRSLEIHIIDHQIESAPKEIIFSIHSFIRSVENFDTPEKLVVQIGKDVEKIKKFLKSNS